MGPEGAKRVSDKCNLVTWTNAGLTQTFRHLPLFMRRGIFATRSPDERKHDSRLEAPP